MQTTVELTHLTKAKSEWGLKKQATCAEQAKYPCVGLGQPRGNSF